MSGQAYQSAGMLLSSSSPALTKITGSAFLRQDGSCIIPILYGKCRLCVLFCPQTCSVCWVAEVKNIFGLVFHRELEKKKVFQLTSFLLYGQGNKFFNVLSTSL